MDKILRPIGNMSGNTSVMARQDLYHSFVCSQNQKAVQTLGDLYQRHWDLAWCPHWHRNPSLWLNLACLLQDWLPCHSALPLLTLHSVSLMLYSPLTKGPDILWACLGELSCASAMQLSTSCLCLSSGTMILLHSVHSGKIWVAPHCAWEWPDPGTCTDPAGWRKARLANSSFVSM